ncbi:MAG: hypothetical protein JNM96_07510 [Bacteroidia bacterium]|nr:hypothetical protein [Bacteroidia bacterium]
MKGLLKYFILFALITLLSTCKKYDEGGLLRLNRKHLFGERKDFASKTWKLEKYEVNGIDSTYLIPGANQIPDFYENFITFTLDNKEGYSFKAKSYIFEYNGNLGFYPSHELIIGNSFWPYDANDSAQCGFLNSNFYCLRNIFFPEYNLTPGVKSWEIIKLKKNELIIVNRKLSNSYQINLSYNK